MRTIFLLAIIVVTPSLIFAQVKKKKKHKDAENTVQAPPPPRVWIGNIHTYYTCRDSILAHPVINTDSVGCRVSGFTVSLQAPGHDFFGPLYSNTWEMTDIQKSKIKEWDFKDVTLYIQDIHLNCHEKDATTTPFSVKFDH